MRASRLRPLPMALVLLSLLPATAMAGDAALVIAGEIDRAGDAAVAKTAEDALRQAGWTPMRPVSPAAVVDALRQCYQAGDEPTCRRAADGVPDVERILVLDFGGGPNVTVTGWIVSGEGRLVLVAQRFCESCNTESLAKTAADLVAALMRDSAGSAATSLLKIRSQPGGARVLVDGRAIGVTDLEYKVYPGRHEVTIDKPGYAIEVREVRADTGATLDVAVDLQEQTVEPRSTIRRPLGIGLAAAGAAAGAVGTWLILADSPKEESGDMQRTYRDSFWPGVGLAAAGVAGLGIGAWLFFTAPDDEDEQPTATIAPAIDGEEAWVFACGAF